ncbi:polyprenyl synthetase family protein [Agrococcus sp. BE272]|uniref:polyprenyl synthetase family protein n=1 Tax=Agrococcus sp. BE272 TaxID=2817727 RepID=UPI002854D6A1|nr:polyprenyl synthetase family protein [Agrococcus sp. BE272]MDR7233901.1 geranylgeranyl diphosphate synthase type II [Agrococcus sp. BE272]
MTAIDAPTLLAEVEQRLARLAAPTGPHPVQAAAAGAVGGGKLLRPRLVLVAAGEGADREAVVATAAAIELLHAALLVHDDVIDDDDERRGQPSVSRRAAVTAAEAGLSPAAAQRLGLTTAIVAGDALLVRALAALARLDVPTAVRVRLVDIVERAMIRAAEGEHDDVLLAGSTPDDETIDRILRGKTADYSFRAPLELGAVLGGRDEAAIEALGEIGLRMGVVYQLRDDVLGVFGDEATTGKSVLSDIRAGTPTMLSALASREPQWASVSRHYGDPDADEGAAARIRSVMRGSGALGEVERRIAEGADEVRAMLVEAPIEQRLRDDLQLIVERCAERRR